MTHTPMTMVKFIAIRKGYKAEGLGNLISPLTSIWVVQNHQFSMGFSDLIPVGCGTERQDSELAL